MKTITIRDLRQRWPEAEAALAVEKEILITRDSKPVARLLRIESEKSTRERWDSSEHARWQQKVAGRTQTDSDHLLSQDRSDRKFE
jgi:antitoxin (DNA-binding transcriptional repressor) of toxin-antitoxin stability system